MSYVKYLVLCVFGLGLFFTSVYFSKTEPSILPMSAELDSTDIQVQTALTPPKVLGPIAEQETDTVTYSEVDIPNRSSFYNALVKQQIPPQTVLEITKAAKSKFDLRHLAPGTKMILAWSKEKLNKLRILISGTEELHVNSDDDGDWQADMIEHEVKIELTAFFGEITSTLWDSAVTAGMPVDLISELSDIFASQVDFSRELNVKDQWSILVEKQMVGAQQVGFRNILAAEITRRGENLSAFRYIYDDRTRYYDLDGNSNRGKFLKSPLRYNKISSRFQNARFHPILKRRRPHLGVDLAAPTGTPVRAVGDGTVLEAGRNGGSGIMVKVRHDHRYMTAYKHLSKIASGVRIGSRIDQGQIIGYVGQTGLATGPHLHFEFYEDGRYVDPLGKRFPHRDTIDGKHKPGFRKEVERLSDLLKAFKEKSKGFEASLTKKDH